MNGKDRYQKRKQMRNSSSVHTDIDNQLMNEFLNSDIDKTKIKDMDLNINEHYTFEYDLTVSKDEAEAFLIQFQKDFNDERFKKLIDDCKQDIINSIVTPFGLGKLVAAYDKTGGNVDTINNVREGIYATQEENNKYDNRGDYNSDEYHKDTNYININRKYSEARKNGDAEDYMTGEKLDLHKSHDLDHVKSAKEIHDDAGRVLAEIDGSTLANTETNLKPTTATNNRSKKTDDMQKFLDKKNERIKQIETLKSKNSLSEKEQNELKKLEELSKIDDQKALAADKVARKKIDTEINKTYYTSGKFAKSVAITGAFEGSKMGMQQALGFIITEFFTAVFDEIIDIYQNGYSTNFDDDRFFSVLKERLKRISIRLKDKWKDVAIALKDGFISGFISNLVTTVINAFITTGKRVVRIIREGIFSLLKAIKVLLFPPENMTYEEAMHEAKKLLATGVIVSLGVIAEEYIQILLEGTAILAPFADILTSMFVGALTGLAVTMTVYYLDKKKNDKDAINELLRQTNNKFGDVALLLNELQQ